MIHYPGSMPDFKSHYNIRDIIFNITCAWDSMKHKTSRTIWIKLCFGVLSSGDVLLMTMGEKVGVLESIARKD